MTTYHHPATGHRVTLAGYPIAIPGAALTGNESAADMALFGYEPYTPPVVPDVPLADLATAALVRYRSEAGECLRSGLPSPWDILREVATPEFQSWADEFCALVADELTRLEMAVSVARTAEELSAIVADWPEVTP